MFVCGAQEVGRGARGSPGVAHGEGRPWRPPPAAVTGWVQTSAHDLSQKVPERERPGAETELAPPHWTRPGPQFTGLFLPTASHVNYVFKPLVFVGLADDHGRQN